MLPAPRPARKRYTIDEYLTLERAAFERHIFLDGTITAMAGESLAHGQISVNLVVAVGSQLKGKPCQALTKDTKVRSCPPGPRDPRSFRGLFSYPDIVIVCGPVEHHDEHKDVILNPTAVIEVLSPSTEAFDRGEKFARYRDWNPTLTDYVVVAQTRPLVEQFTRQPDGRWLFTIHDRPDAVLTIASVGVSVPLADVYDRVEFPPVQEEPEPEA